MSEGFHIGECKESARWSNKIVWTMLFKMLYGWLRVKRILRKFQMCADGFWCLCCIYAYSVSSSSSAEDRVALTATWSMFVDSHANKLKIDRLNSLRTTRWHFIHGDTVPRFFFTQPFEFYRLRTSAWHLSVHVWWLSGFRHSDWRNKTVY